jgi:hypothetical protein
MDLDFIIWGGLVIGGRDYWWWLTCYGAIELFPRKRLDYKKTTPSVGNAFGETSRSRNDARAWLFQDKSVRFSRCFSTHVHDWRGSGPVFAFRLCTGPARGLKMEEQHLPRKLFQFPNHRPPQFPPQFPNHSFSSFRIRNKLHFRRPSPHLWKSILTFAQKNRFPIDFAAGLGRGHCTGFTTQTHGEKL